MTAGAAAAAVGAAAGTIAANFGAGAATVATVTSFASGATTVAAAAATGAQIAFGLSDITEIATDGYNPVRDDLLGGNQEAYDKTKLVVDLVTEGINYVGSCYGEWGDDDTSSGHSYCEDDFDDTPQETPKKSRNPNGRKGCEEHQKMIDDIYNNGKKGGGEAKKEVNVSTKGGEKNSRSVDVAVTKDGETDYYQVGVTNKTGMPNTFGGAVSRERRAANDLIKFGGISPERLHFITYKIN